MIALFPFAFTSFDPGVIMSRIKLHSSRQYTMLAKRKFPQHGI